MTPMCLPNAKDSPKHFFSILVGSSFCKVRIDALFQYCCCFAWGGGEKKCLNLHQQWGRKLRRKRWDLSHNLPLIMPGSTGSCQLFFIITELQFCGAYDSLLVISLCNKPLQFPQSFQNRGVSWAGCSDGHASRAPSALSNHKLGHVPQ